MKVIFLKLMLVWSSLVAPFYQFASLQQATETPITDATPNQDKLNDLALIEKRLDNWFVRQSQSSVRFEGNVKKRWESLQDEVDRSHNEFGELTIAKSSEGVITGITYSITQSLNQSIINFFLVDFTIMAFLFV